MSAPRAFLLCALLAAPAVAAAISVTVHSDGTTGDHATVSAALAAVQAESPGPGNADFITILDEGPFREPLLLLTGDAHANNLVIRGAPGVRAIIASTSTGNNAIELAKPGRVELRGLVVIPATGLSQPAQRALLYRSASAGAGYDYHLEDVLITSNDGFDRPLGSRDGMQDPGPVSLRQVSFRGAGGIHGNSTDSTAVYQFTMRHVVVTAITSPTPYGLRTFQDGAAGSALTVGEGCVFSYLRSSTGDPLAAAINIGGNEGAPGIASIQGSPEEPVVVLANRANGLWLTGANAESNAFRDMVIAGNTGEAILHTNPLMSSTYEDVTVIGNGAHALLIADNNRQPIAFNGAITASGVVFAGNGTNGSQNLVRTAGTGAGTVTLTSCAVVTLGPYRLNRLANPTGIISGTPSNVVQQGVLNADPLIRMLDPAAGLLGRVTAPEHATAGPSGAPLSGATPYGPPAAGDSRDWLFRD